MNKRQLEQKLAGWRDARRIAEYSSASAQFNCYLEEREELMDAIGDCVVTLLNTKALSPDYYQKLACEVQILRLRLASIVAGVNFNQCLSMAWNEIQYRIGLVRSTGKFTKWKDLTHEERCTVAKAGQMNGAPIAVIQDACTHCTYEEWMEILVLANF